MLGAERMPRQSSAQTAAAPDTAPDAALASTAQATPGCDGNTPPPPGVGNWWNTYDGWWLTGWDACQECDADAKLLAAVGLSTWCWETASPGKLAELWYGTGGSSAGVSGAPPDTSGQFTRVTSREQLRELVRSATERHR